MEELPDMITRLARERAERQAMATEKACEYAIEYTTTKGVEVHTYIDGGWSVTVTERVPYGHIHTYHHHGTTADPQGHTLDVRFRT